MLPARLRISACAIFGSFDIAVSALKLNSCSVMASTAHPSAGD